MPLTAAQKEYRLKMGLPVPDADDVKAFVLAAANDDIASMRDYIRRFGPECADETHAVTALMNAALYGHADSIEFLLASGADIHARDIHGFTAANYTVHTDDAETLKLLLDRGARLDQVTEDRMTLLIVAAWQGAKSCVRLLLSRGCDINAVDSEAMDAAERAMCGDHDDIVEILKEHRAELKRREHLEKVAAVKSAFEKGTAQQHNAKNKGSLKPFKPDLGPPY